MIRFVYAKTSNPIDGIRSYAERCCEALRAHAGLDAELELWDRNQQPGLREDDDIIVVQYNPFSYGRRGFAPWIVRRLRAARRESAGLRIILVVHEAYVPRRSLKWAAMGAWQQAQLALIGRLADAVVISTEAWRPAVTRLTGRPPLAAIPVGSNLPDLTVARDEARRERGWEPDTLVVAALGADRAARLPALASAALDAIAEIHPKVVFANLGTAPLDMPVSDLVLEHHSPGLLTPDALARDLAAADVFLAPYEDGVSMRRTTLAAALQHSLAIVGTNGRNTEPELRASSALRLAGPDLASFAQVANEVARDPDIQGELRREARAFFDRRLSWPVIAGQYREAFEAVRGE